MNMGVQLSLPDSIRESYGNFTFNIFEEIHFLAPSVGSAFF